MDSPGKSRPMHAQIHAFVLQKNTFAVKKGASKKLQSTCNPIAQL